MTDELKTVARQYRWGGDERWRYFGPIFGDEPREVRELVTRSQAETVIAAERAAKEKADKRVEFLLKQISRAADERKAIEADNAAKDARIKELGDERYKLAYAIAGGEDAPGYLDSLSVETLVEVARDNSRRWFAETDRAEALETQLAAAMEIVDLVIKSRESYDDWAHVSLIDEAYEKARAALEAQP